MPRLSPSASFSAWPSASAQSSTVWCSSMCRSPAQRTSQREAAVLAHLFQHVVEETEAGHAPPDRRRDPGRRSTRIRVSLVSALDAGGARRIGQRVGDVAPAHASSNFGLSGSRGRRDWRRTACRFRGRRPCALRIEVDAAIAQVVQHQADARLAGRRVVLVRKLLVDQHLAEADALRGRGSAAASACGPSKRLARIALGAQPVLVGDHDEFEAGVAQPEQGRDHALDEAELLDRSRSVNRPAPRSGCRRDR